MAEADLLLHPHHLRAMPAQRSLLPHCYIPTGNSSGIGARG